MGWQVFKGQGEKNLGKITQCIWSFSLIAWNVPRFYVDFSTWQNSSMFSTRQHEAEEPPVMRRAKLQNWLKSIYTLWLCQDFTALWFQSQIMEKQA